MEHQNDVAREFEQQIEGGDVNLMSKVNFEGV